MSFPAFLKTFRQLVKQGEAAKLQRMFLLVETKPMTAIWRSGPYSSWNALLKGERLSSVPCFRDFERATTILKKTTIEAIGADAAVVLARIEEPLVKPVLDKIRSFIELNGARPSRPIVWSWVHSMRYIPAPVMTPTGLRSRARH